MELVAVLVLLVVGFLGWIISAFATSRLGVIGFGAIVVLVCVFLVVYWSPAETMFGVSWLIAAIVMTLLTISLAAKAR